MSRTIVVPPVPPGPRIPIRAWRDGEWVILLANDGTASATVSLTLDEARAHRATLDKAINEYL